MLTSFRSASSGPVVLKEVSPGVTLLGTAHVSAKSLAQVEDEIRSRRPDRVLVELDARRLDAIRDPERMAKMDVVKLIKEKRHVAFLLQLYLANQQARVGEQTGVSPGSEMLRAIEVADEIGAQVVLIDRDVRITLARGLGAMGLWRRLRVLSKLMAGAFDESAPEDVDAMLESDAITAMTEQFSLVAPEFKEALIDERDLFMATHVQQESRLGSVLAVVGAGHVPGMIQHLAQGEPLRKEHLNAPPVRRVPWLKLFGILLTGAVLAAFASLALTGDWQAFREAWLVWILVNGTLSAIGTLIAGGHPLSMLTAFVAAPLTSLSPALAAGWFAGVAEAKLRPPRGVDLATLKQINGFADWRRNRVLRILLVTALANVGSALGTWLGLAKLVQLLGA